MNRHVAVRQFMSDRVVFVDIEAPLSTVRDLLRRRGFHHAPVTQGGRLVGILSSTDLARYALDAWVDDPATSDAHLDARFAVANVMTHEPIAVDPNASARHAAMLLASGDFHALPVTEPDGTLVGIVTSTDLLRLFAAG